MLITIKTSKLNYILISTPKILVTETMTRLLQKPKGNLSTQSYRNLTTNKLDA